MKKILFSLLVLLGFTATSQVKIGDNPTTIDSSSILEIESTTRGFLPPRVTTPQRNAISRPTKGLMVYNTTENCIQVNVGTPVAPAWQCTSGINSSTGGTAEAASYGTPACAANTINGTLTQGLPVSGVTMTLNVNVTQIGSWNIAAGPTNGVTFSGSGNFTATGCQAITLTGTGTPTTAGASTFTTNTTPSGSATTTVAILEPSSGGTAVVASWTSTVGCSVGAGPNNSPAGVIQGAVNSTMVAGLPSTDTVTLVANVTSLGSYNVVTNAINGKTFRASGTFAATGSQTVNLTSIGEAPSAAGNHVWSLNATPAINIYGSTLTTSAPLGSSYTAHFNGCDSASNTLHSVAQPFTAASYTGGDVFSNNTLCQNSPISAQGCGGVTSVPASSGRVHTTVNINGQCWLTTSLITIPTVYNAYTATSWTVASPGDQGYWGYYHTTDTTGASGWQATEPAANEGLFYQWCGAMDANISERSRGICPAGFHIPSDCEWMYLEHGQGMSISEQNIFNGSIARSSASDNQGTPGYKLRSQGGGQTNATGFSGLLPGRRQIIGLFSLRTLNGYNWSSTVSTTTRSYIRFFKADRGVFRADNTRAGGFPIRCLKD